MDSEDQTWVLTVTCVPIPWVPLHGCSYRALTEAPRGLGDSDFRPQEGAALPVLL